MNIINTVRRETIGSDDRIKAVIATRDLWLEELKRAQKAVEEENKRINFLIEQRFNELNLKAVEGELIYLPEYDLSYFWANGKLVQLPTKVLGSTKNELE
jgi:xylose isomerase